MNRKTVAVTDSVFPTLDLARRVLEQIGAEISVASDSSSDAILEVARQADGILVTYAQVRADIIRQLRRCRIIARFGIGVDNIDIGAATQAGIVVTNVPDYCIDEVSDHTLALLLSLARKIPFSNQQAHAGHWELTPVAPLYRLKGKTLGLVGFGKIPRLVAPKAQAFGLEVLTYDPFISDQVFANRGVKGVEFAELLERSDYISIHAPLTPETHHMFNSEAFRRMKPTACLINSARGPLIDEKALIEALDNHQLAAAALDVLNEEPPGADSPLFGRHNVILTPHTAFYSVESLLDLQTQAAKEVALVLSGQTPNHPVNPEVLAQQRTTQ